MRWIPKGYALSYRREPVADGAWWLKGNHVSAVPSPRGDVLCVVGDHQLQCLDAATFEPLRAPVHVGRTIGAAARCDAGHLLVCRERELSRWDARAGERIESAPVMAWGMWHARPLPLSATGVWAVAPTGRTDAAPSSTVGHADDLGAARTLRLDALTPRAQHVSYAVSPDGGALLVHTVGASSTVHLCDLHGRPTDVVARWQPGMALERALWTTPDELYYGTDPVYRGALWWWQRGREAVARRTGCASIP